MFVGHLIATGSEDKLIKVFDVEKMMARTAVGHQDSQPLIQTFYDHEDAVTALDFHPSVAIIASGSRDSTCKLFDYSKPSVKKSCKMIRDVAGIQTLKFHPSGEFLLVGTTQSTSTL